MIATTSSEAKAARLRTLGADEVIDYRATPAWHERVRALTGGRGAQFLAMNRAIEVNGLMPVIDRVFPFDEAVEAYRYYLAEQPLGKVVIAHP